MKTGLFVVAFCRIYPQGSKVLNVRDKITAGKNAGNKPQAVRNARTPPEKREQQDGRKSPKSRLIDRGAVIQKYSLYTSFCAFCDISEKVSFCAFCAFCEVLNM